MQGAPWFRKASEEEKLDCCGVRVAAPETNMSVPPAAKYTTGTMITTGPSIAKTCAASVSTEARKPEHSEYSNMPPPMKRMPWVKLNGNSRDIKAPLAMKLEVTLTMEPTMLETESINWLDFPCQAYMTSARVWALGAAARIRLPKG